MKIVNPYLEILAALTVIVLSGGCSQVHLSEKSSQHPESTAPKTGQGEATPNNINLTGDWQVAFQFNGQTVKSVMHLKQAGNAFSGDGTDTPDGHQFVIENGTLNGNEVDFFKKYPGFDPAQAPPVEYTGKVEMVNEKDYQGPYMNGDYGTLVKGQSVTGPWEAQMGTAVAQPESTEQTSSPAAPVVPDKAPDLSGKWKFGYEYNFTTIQSTVFLEQDSGKIVGHGIDTNTKEKFTIEKGWYNFPRLTLVRKYLKGKGAKASRTMIFKGTISIVNDSDYQGPYLSGKTQGGGAWEAQLVK